MIHIVDHTQELRELTTWTRHDRSRRRCPRYVCDRNLIVAHLVAVRQPTGLYRVLKYRFGLPRTHVRRATLQRYIDRILEGVGRSCLQT